MRNEREQSLTLLEGGMGARLSKQNDALDLKISTES